MGALSKIRKALLAGAGGVAALAAVNAAVARRGGGGRTREVEPEQLTLGGEAHAFVSRHGRVFFKTAGAASAPPLVLIHGVGVGDSALTWRKNFDYLARSFRVYAPDLLGFGFSDKPPTAPYSAELYVELIADFLREVAGGPADVIACSLGGAYAVHAADRVPALVKSLTLVAPNGGAANNRQQTQSRPGVTGAAFYGLLHSPVLGTSFYNAMASERGLRDNARQRLFYDKSRVTPKTVARYYALSHQPGAQHALVAFFSGYLNTNWHGAFARLSARRVTLIWGRHDRANLVDRAEHLLRLNPQASLHVFDRSRALPHEEQSEEFNQLVIRTLLARSAAA